MVPPSSKQATPALPKAAVTPKPTLAKFWILECKNPGSHQSIAVTPWVKNTTGKTIPTGHKIYWWVTYGGSGGGSGVITLEKNLPPGQEVMGLLVGNHGNNYTCTAYTLPF